MNDRFRFRAWDKSFRKYCENVIISMINGEITVYERLVNGNTVLIPSAHVVLEQCTGLKDENGKLIYEGDIVKYTRTNWYCPGHPKHNHDLIEINEIFWDEEEYSFRRRGKFPGGNGSGWIGSIKFHDSRADENIIEVIGNIHENPELLEGGK